jgi:hypothetical protein
MLTSRQKEALLRQAGVAVPTRPLNGGQDQQQQLASHRLPSPQAAGMSGAHAWRQWTDAIDALYACYALARATRSLREHDEARRRSTPHHPASRAPE